MSPPIFLILGATGAQGSSILTYFLTHHPSQYTYRSITRNPSSPKALALSSLGVQMFQADISDLESLKRAFEDVKFVFAYTDYYSVIQSPGAMELLQSGKGGKDLAEAAGLIEAEQGRNIALAAASVPTLERLIWSSAPSIPGVWEMCSKASAWEYMLSLEGLRGKVSAVIFGVFHDSLLRYPEMMGWKKIDAAKKRYRLQMPTSLEAGIPYIDMPSSAGKWVETLLRAPAGIVVGAGDGYMSLNEFREILGRKLEGVEILLEKVSVEEFADGDESGAMKSVGKMWAALGQGGLEGMVGPGEMEKMGFKVEQRSVKEAMEEVDWLGLL